MPDRRAEAAAILSSDFGPDFGPLVDAPTQAVIVASSGLQNPVLGALCGHSIRLGFRKLTMLNADRTFAEFFAGATRML